MAITMTALYGWKVKFLTGLLAGQVLSLPLGKTRIGSDDEADLFVASIDGSAFDISLTPCEGGLRVEFSGTGNVGGQPVHGSATLTGVAEVSSAGVRFIAAPADASFDVVPQSLNKGQAAGITRHFDLAVIACATLAVVASAASAVGVAPAPAGLDLPVPNIRTLLLDVKNSPAMGGATIKQQDGKILIYGNCRDSAGVSSIVDRLEGAGQIVEDTAVCDDDLRRAVLTVLRSNGFSGMLVTTGVQPGTVVIHGSADENDAWRTVSKLLSGIAGLNGWTLRDDVDGYLKSLLVQLKRLGLADKLSVVRDGNWVVISGVLNQGEQASLASVIQDVRSKADGNIKISYENTSSLERPERYFPSPIASIGGSGALSYIQLADGSRLQATSILPNGFRVSEISPDGVELAKNNELVHIPLSF